MFLLNLIWKNLKLQDNFNLWYLFWFLKQPNMKEKA